MMKCKKCGVDMDIQPYKHPYIANNGVAFENVNVDVYICPCCGREQEVLPNIEDGYSAGEGLFYEE